MALSKSQFYEGKIVALTSPSSPDPLQVKIIRRIVESSTSDVYKASDLRDKTRFIALKRFKGDRGKTLGQREKLTLERIQKEKSLKNNIMICQFMGFREEIKGEEYSYTIALEFCGKTLHNIKKVKKFTLGEVKAFAEDLILIFSHFQKIGLFYRDIKPGNMIYSNSIDKIIDFDVSLWLDEIPLDEENGYMMNLVGTLKYMAPEIAKYFPLEKRKISGSSESNWENTEKTLHITRKEMKIDEKVDVLSKVSGSDCFKMDVFSLGLVILELLSLVYPRVLGEEFEIEEINRDENKLKDAMDKINTKKNLLYLNDLLEKMLAWEQNDRWDFIELEDYLLYEKSLDFTKKYNYLDIEAKFTSISTFSNIWDTKDMNDIQSHFFSIGYLAKFSDKEYIKTLLLTSSEPNYEKKVSIELQPFQKHLNNGILIEDMIKWYTSNEANGKIGEFYKDLNFCLGKNKVEKYRYYLTAFLKLKNKLVQPISTKILYRVILLDGTPKWNFEAKNQYFPGMNYYWPSFTSCTMSEIVKDCWIRERAECCEKSTILLFVIRINEQNTSNKIDISKFSMFPEEQEMLLLPYFSFRVKSNQPVKIEVNGKCRTVCRIEVEEIDRKVIKFWIVWLNSEDHMSMNEIAMEFIINKKYGDFLRKFNKMEDAVNFMIKSKRTVTIVILNGKDGEKFLEKIKGLEHVAKVLLLVENKNDQEKLAQTYKEIQGRYDNPLKLINDLPDPDIFY